MDDLLDATDPRHVAATGIGWDDIVSRVTAAQHAVLGRGPGLRELWFDKRAWERMQDIHLHHRRELAMRYRATARAALGRPGDLPDHEIWIETSSALWDLAFALDDEGHPAVVAEITSLGHEHGRRLRATSR